jgi:hypothetical protein
VDLDEVLAATFSLIAPHLTGRQRRLLFGAAARALGYGGVSRVARLAEASRPTVRRGAAELDRPADPRGRIRQHNGPKRLRERDPGLIVALDRLVDPDTRGDPESPLRWTCKSTRGAGPGAHRGRASGQRRLRVEGESGGGTRRPGSRSCSSRMQRRPKHEPGAPGEGGDEAETGFRTVPLYVKPLAGGEDLD